VEEHSQARTLGQALPQGAVNLDALRVVPLAPDPTRVLGFDAADEPTDPGTEAVDYLNPVHFSSFGSCDGREVLRVLRLPRWKHYRDLRFLAEGGMGRIFSAFDPDLQRPVALKFLQQDDYDLAKRFELEAQSQAKVDHPNVCKVYEVGEWKGQPYMAMQLIEGESLAACQTSLNQEQKLSVMERVAEAVHAAHRQGLIHRDLKPSNVMIERGEDGNPIPYVLDFGLARGMETTGQTVQGSIVGTYHYMAPEQAQGDHDKLDRRTDVYALGCTLFELFTGTPPFGETEGVGCLRRILDEAVPLLRTKDAQIAVDLETIVAKCLEKDPDRRYASARALAEELRRFRDGEPILARPATLTYRASKFARRNKAAVVVAAVGLVAVLSVGAFGLYQWVSSSRRAYWAQHYGQEAERIEALVRYAHLQPLHDIRSELQQVAERLSHLQEQSSKSGRLAEGPAAYALGRSHLALGDSAKARTYLDRAWSQGLRTPEVSFALGRALGQQYQRGLELARRIPDREVREARLRELQHQLRDPALNFLRTGAGVALESPNYYGALLAFYEQRHDDAVLLCRKSLVQRPWFYEAKLLEGEILQAKAKESNLPKQVLRDLPLALEAFREARRLAPSDDATYLGEARVWRDHLIAGLSSGEDWRTPLKACEVAAASAMTIRDSNAAPLGVLAVAMGRAAESLLQKGGNPEHLLNTTLKKAEQSLAIDSTNLESMAAQASAFEVLANWQFTQGKDPFFTSDQGIQTASRALALDPNDATLLSVLTLITRRKMTFEMHHGRSPWLSFEASLKLVDRFQKLYPILVGPYREIAALFVERADFERTHGMDPQPSLDRAMAANRQALSLNANNPYLLEMKGYIHVVQAQHEIAMFLDPAQSLMEAERAFQSARALNPERGYSLDLSAVLLLNAESQFEQGRNCDHLLARAEECLGSGLKTHGNDFWAHHLAGGIAFLEAKLAHQQGRDPNLYLVSSEKRFKKSWELGKWADSQVQLADLYFTKGRWKPSRKTLAQGKEAVQLALQAHPDHAEAWLNLGALEVQESRLGPKTKSLLAIEKARASIRRALKINGNLKMRAQRILP